MCLVSVEAKNESSKDMGKVLATLVQRVVFTANDESKSTNLGMSSMETELPLAKVGVRSYSLVPCANCIFLSPVLVTIWDRRCYYAEMIVRISVC